ncbi:MAG: GreA/GreB family elongation factor [Weeksellaceae bacterium]
MRKVVTFTPEGHTKLKAEYDELNAGRPAVVAELTRARDLGDRSENGAYKAARWKLSGLDRRLRELKRALDAAQIVAKPTSGVIGLGSSVKLTQGALELNVTIVGGYEVDLAAGKLSHFSPLGKTLLGHKTGETVQVHTPAGLKEYYIASVA